MNNVTAPASARGVRPSKPARIPDGFVTLPDIHHPHQELIPDNLESIGLEWIDSGYLRF
ncbi:hypothetical protein HT746_06850 [Burkholderia pyrrocinia]|uniref:hypothetical protein n=1 Tax=Burkholderia pyrrocinia TaxID=60550 RepID=UPI00157755D7|nr:hypothetical protein [Burkholderia pyrrocinia]NTX26852.1 hypothetical protein [Burkholderia pyrrocinia]QVN23654.1 hypothetical protein JYG32_34960 [Burkholderia pyrrocinia]